MKIQITLEDIFGDHDDEFKSKILNIFKMELPAYVILTFPEVLVKKMQEVQKVADTLHLSSVKFGLSLQESTEREKVELFRADGTAINVSQYEEAGMRDVVEGFSLEYAWFYQSFQAQLIYCTSYTEEVFLTRRFKLSSLS